MPYSIQFEENGRGVLLEFAGDVTGDDFINATKEMYSSDSEANLRYQIIDLTNTQSMKVDDDDLRSIALLDQRAASINPGQVVALVGPSQIFYGSNRRYAIYAEVWAGFESKDFRDMESARSWIASSLKDSETAAN